MRIGTAIALFLVFSTATFSQSGPVNLDFESGETGRAPSGWIVPPTLQQAGYSAELRREGCRSGTGCAVVLVPASPSSQAFGNLMQQVDGTPYRGQTVRLSAWVRLEAVESTDRTQLWFRVDRQNGQVGFFDNMGSRPITSAEWRRYSIQGEIDADARLINFGLISIGKGRAWLDAVSLEVIPASEIDTDAARRSIQQRYDQIDTATERGDLDSLMKFVLPDATVVALGRELPFRTMIDAAKAQLAQGAKLSSRTTITSIRAAGDDVIVVVRNEGGYSSSSGRNAYVSVANDTWTLTTEGWKLRKSAPVSARPVAALTDPDTIAKLAAEIKRYATPLVTVQAGNKTDDLAAFGKAVGEARIVALGEASHGTREFFQMKHRLLEYLVKEKGFTVFAIEANWPESLAVDRYIKTGEGDPRVALAGMYFWTWNTQEVLDMIEWMRAYNKAAGKPLLTFTSFDMQQHSVAAERVSEYLRKTLPAEGPALEAAYQGLKSLKPGQMNDSNATAVAAQAEKIVTLFDNRRSEMIRGSSLAAWRDARQAAEIVRQAAASHAPGAASGYRDEMMARNVEWLADEAYPGEKIVLWAHNGHVRVAEESGVKMMGSWLRQRFGKQMYVVGFAFHRGAVRAVGTENGTISGLANHIVPASQAGTGDSVLSAAGLPVFFLDMQPVPVTSDLRRWLAEPHVYRAIGAVWNKTDPDANVMLESMSDSYDGLIFVEEGHAAQGLSTPPRPAM
jgi:erythromycin esterase